MDVQWLKNFRLICCTIGTAGAAGRLVAATDFVSALVVSLGVGAEWRMLVEVEIAAAGTNAMNLLQVSSGGCHHRCHCRAAVRPSTELNRMMHDCRCCGCNYSLIIVFVGL